MISLAVARIVADHFINAARTPGDRREIDHYEFEQGFVFWEVEPPGPDPLRPPASVGAGCVVVDRITGEPSSWPAMAAVEIARRYPEGSA